MSTVVEVFTGVNMGKQHRGLFEIAKSYSINLSKLSMGTAALFISKDKSKVKAFFYNGVLAYYKNPEGRPLTIESLKNFALALDHTGGTAISVDASILMSLESDLSGEEKFVSQGRVRRRVRGGKVIVRRNPNRFQSGQGARI